LLHLLFILAEAYNNKHKPRITLKMNKLNKNQKGFTVVELVIIIIVVAILSAIVLGTNNGIQQKSRNTERQTDIQMIQSKLEAFYSQNGYYPSLTNMNTLSWRKTNLPALNSSYLIDPSSYETANTVQLAASPGPKVYSYQVTDSNGNSCESDDTNCAKYTLTATYEGKVDGSKTYQKQNLD
jgi:general secretion pathway protein G